MQVKDPRTNNEYKDPPPRHRYQMLRAIHRRQRAAQIAAFWTKTDLLQYRDTIPFPNTYTITDSDVFCDTPNLQADWIPPCANDIDPFEGLTHLPSTIITSLVDSIDVLCHYKSILSLTGEAAFFNSRYNRLDPSTSLHKSILIQANHLKSQVFHYDNYRDRCTDSTQEVCVSSSGDELPIVIDTGASNSITPTTTDFTGTIRRSSLQSLKQVNGTTPVCGEGEVLWDIEDLYGTRQSVITDAYFVPTATIRLFSSQVYIDTNSTTHT